MTIMSAKKKIETSKIETSSLKEQKPLEETVSEENKFNIQSIV